MRAISFFCIILLLIFVTKVYIYAIIYIYWFLYICVEIYKGYKMITGINTNGYEYSKSRDGIGTTITLKRADNGAIILDIQDATAAEI